MTKKKPPAKAHKHKARAKKAPAPASRAKVSPPARKVLSRPRPRPVQKAGRFAGQPYRSSQADYQQRYDKSLATIKRWWKEGKPLDDPDAMGEFLSPRGRKPAVPDEWEKPSRTEQRIDDDDDLPPHLAMGTEDPRDVPIPIELDEAFFTDSGILAAIERLKKAERERAAAYFEAIKRRVHPQILQNRFKEWLGIIEALRKVAKDEPEIRKANDLTVDKSEIEASVGQVFAAFRQAARNLPARAAAKVIGLRDHDEILDVLEREVEVLIRTLVEIAVTQAAAADAPAPVPVAATPAE
ncbi:MAG: hypothetical protein P4L99_28015 [Chthoniobacter sp.]|nr:hypothetical protein [Chthoniobacter sp.]